jgi:hypothetical protein
LIVLEAAFRCTSRIVSVFASRKDGSLARWSEPISSSVWGLPGLGSVICLDFTPPGTTEIRCTIVFTCSSPAVATAPAHEPITMIAAAKIRHTIPVRLLGTSHLMLAPGGSSRSDSTGAGGPFGPAQRSERSPKTA